MLIKDIETIRAIVNITQAIDFDQIKSSVQDAENEFIIPVIGREFYDEINEAYEPVSPDLDDAQQKFIDKVQKPLAYLAVMLWLPEGMVKLSGDGLHIISDEYKKTAWQWQSDKLEFKYLRSGYRDIDLLLTFLEENAGDYETWAESSAFTATKENFIPNASAFSQFYDIKNSRLTFLRLKPMMTKCEDFFAKSNLGEKYFNSLKESILEDDVSEDDLVTIKYLQKSLAHFTISRALDEGLLDINAEGVSINLFNDSIRSKAQPNEMRLQNASQTALKDGHSYMRQLLNFLNANAAANKYEDYFTGGQYVSQGKSPVITNSAEKKHFVAR